MKFATFFYPGYYQCGARNSAAGFPIDEWALLRRALPSVFTETIENIPLLGYTDCSEPEVLATEASLARAHGIDAFVFNFYFDGDVAELERPLATFATLNSELEFAINLCCHMPKRKLPFGIGEDHVAPYSYWTEDQFRDLAEYLCNTYGRQSNYLRHGGSAVLTFYHVKAFIYLYGPDGLAHRLKIIRNVWRRAGMPLHIVGLFSVVGGWNTIPADSRGLPFDSYSCYVALPDFESNDPIQSFPRLAAKWLATTARRDHNTADAPLVACVGAGWNATPRGASGYDPAVHGLRFPYYPIVVDDNPAAFEAYLRDTATRAETDPRFARDLLFLGPWNEWSEGCYLLPDQRYGSGKLEAIRQVKSRLTHGIL